MLISTAADYARELDARDPLARSGRPCILTDKQVLPNFRAPDNIRIGIAPLYTSFTKIHTAALRLHQALAERRYAKYAGSAPVVT